MTRRTRLLFTWMIALCAVPLLGLPAAAEVVETITVTSNPVTSNPVTSNPLTSEDMARTSDPASKWLWIAAPFALGALLFGFTRLWRTPAARD